MSIFDPYQVNKRSTRKTHKGQVLRQKPNSIPGAASKEDLDKAIKICRSYGLLVLDHIPSPEPIYVTDHLLLMIPDAEEGAINYVNGTTQSHTISEDWTELRAQVPEYLTNLVNSDKIRNSLCYVALVSFNFNGVHVNSSGSNQNFSLDFTFSQDQQGPFTYFSDGITNGASSFVGGNCFRLDNLIKTMYLPNEDDNGFEPAYIDNETNYLSFQDLNGVQYLKDVVQNTNESGIKNISLCSWTAGVNNISSVTIDHHFFTYFLYFSYEYQVN